MARLVTIAFLACLAEAVGCHHRRQVVFAPHTFGGCVKASPPIGPPTSLQFARSSAADPSALNGIGRLVAQMTWSSESLAFNTPPPFGRFWLTSFRVHFDSAGYAVSGDTTGDFTGESRFSVITLSAPEGRYRLEVWAFGGGGFLDSSLVIRNGFKDTLRASLQVSTDPWCP